MEKPGLACNISGEIPEAVHSKTPLSCADRTFILGSHKIKATLVWVYRKGMETISQPRCIELCVTDDTNSSDVSNDIDQYIPKNDIPADARALIAAWEASTHRADNESPVYFCSMYPLTIADLSMPPTRFRPRRVASKKKD